MMKIKTSTRLGIGFGLQIVLAVVLGTTVLFNLDEVQRQFQVVAEHDSKVIANARHLSKLVVDMETGQRGFVITAREEFLEPYASGIRDFDELIQKEMELVSDNSRQLASLSEIMHLVEEWKTTAAEPEIAMARRSAAHTMDADHLQAVLGRKVGKDLMDQFTSLAHELQLSFSDRKDWEGAYVVEVIETCMADRKHGQPGFPITGQVESLDKNSPGAQGDLTAHFSTLRSILAQRGREHEVSAQVDRLEALASEWITRAAETEIAASREMNKRPETLQDVAALLQTGRGKILIDRVRQEFDKFIELGEALAARRYAFATRTAANTKRTAIILLVISIGFGIVIFTRTRRAIAIPLTRLVRGAEAVGDGDLSTKVAVSSPDEIGGLTDAFNAMVLRLNEAANRRKELEVQLLHAHKLESIGQLAAGIAHEINTPTQYVGDNTHFLEECFMEIVPLLKKADELADAVGKGPQPTELAADLKAGLGEANVEYLSKQVPRAIQQSLNGIDRVRRIVQSMKEFSHPGGKEMTIVNLNHSIESTITVASHEWKYVAEMQTDLDPYLPPVPCLPVEFNQVVLNLIVNAAHAISGTPSAGAETKGTIKISTHRYGEFMEMRIADTGTGIPVEIRDKIFDPFFTTKEVGMGTGQGLSMAYAVIVQKHGGSLEYETEIGKGTTFIIRLPLESQVVEELV